MSANAPAPIIALPSAPPNPEVITLLENLLDEAKRGEIRGIAVAVHARPRDTVTTYVVDGDVAELVLAIERLKLRLLAYPYEPTPA